MEYAIPDFALIALIGPTGAGKSTFAAKHFLPTEVISSDACRAIVCDDETDQSVSGDAFALVHFAAGLRLKRRKLTVIDSTAAQKEARAQIIKLARQWHAPPVALVFDIDPKLCHQRNKSRPLRQFGEQAPRSHSQNIRKSIRTLRKEGFTTVHVMRSPEEMDAAMLRREPLWTDQRGDSGPFDIIGDVHGCFDELTALLGALGYSLELAQDSEALHRARHPDGRRAFFVGDLCDRGPQNVEVLRLVMGMVQDGDAQCVVGNHDYKLSNYLRGKRVTLNHGLQDTVAELDGCSEVFRSKVKDFVYNLRSHAWLDGGALVIAHAGLREDMHGRGSGALRSFAMFGDTTGERDEFGLPVRLDWAQDYRGDAAVVYGHTPQINAEWVNNTICIDTGCVFGGALTALRWPERTIMRQTAAKQYARPAKPIGHRSGEPVLNLQQSADRLLYVDDMIGKRRIETRWGRSIAIPAENAAAALEAMSRWAIDPRWLIYAPPTMAPAPTASDGPYLERPEEALSYYASQGVSELVAEEKHMGSRALVVASRDAEAARRRFGVEDGRAGVVYSRTGRPFFSDLSLERELVERVAQAVGRAGLWEDLASDWILLDCEITPWSAKAQSLLQRQYGPTATAAKTYASALVDAAKEAHSLNLLVEQEKDALDALYSRAETRLLSVRRFEAAVKQYCWPALSLSDYRLSPFHLLASEGRVYDGKPHQWHMEMIARLAEADVLIQPTQWKRIDAACVESCESLTRWWKDLTESGGEGIVLKPMSFTAKAKRGLKWTPEMGP